MADEQGVDYVREELLEMESYYARFRVLSRDFS